jgi:hypothetical protein
MVRKIEGTTGELNSSANSHRKCSQMSKGHLLYPHRCSSEKSSSRVPGRYSNWEPHPQLLMMTFAEDSTYYLFFGIQQMLWPHRCAFLHQQGKAIRKIRAALHLSDP